MLDVDGWKNQFDQKHVSHKSFFTLKNYIAFRRPSVTGPNVTTLRKISWCVFTHITHAKDSKEEERTQKILVRTAMKKRNPNPNQFRKNNRGKQI